MVPVTSPKRRQQLLASVDSTPLLPTHSHDTDVSWLDGFMLQAAENETPDNKLAYCMDQCTGSDVDAPFDIERMRQLDAWADDLLSVCIAKSEQQSSVTPRKVSTAVKPPSPARQRHQHSDTSATRAPSTASTRKSPSKPKFTSTRARQLYEIKTLKSLATELSAVLQRERNAIGAFHQSPLDRHSSAAQWWEGAAAAQRTQLARAQRNNMHLRRSVLEHRQLFANFQRMLANRVAQCALASERLVRSSVVQHTDVGLLRRLVADVNAMVARTDDTLARLAHTRTAAATFVVNNDNWSRAWSVRHDATGNVVLEVVARHEVPFSVAHVDAAMRSIRNGAGPGRRHLTAQDIGVAPGASTSIIDEVAHVATPVGTGHYRFRRASRSVQDAATAGRSVTAAVAFVDSVDAHGVAVPGFKFEIQMWLVREQRTQIDPLSGDLLVSTVIENFSTVAPVAVRRPYRKRWSRDAVEQLVIPLWDAEAGARLQRIENALFDVQPPL